MSTRPIARTWAEISEELGDVIVCYENRGGCPLEDQRNDLLCLDSCYIYRVWVNGFMRGVEVLEK